MRLTDIINTRLYNQQIAVHKFKKAKEVVSWLGAMQSQDYYMAKWAIGLRLQHSSDKLIERAIEKGEILRTHVMRPTWHFVAPEDICWMLELTAPKIKSALKWHQKWLELSEPIMKKANSIIVKALSEVKYLTRDELMARLSKSKIAINGNRPSHIMLRAEIDGLVCSGPLTGKQQTYALMETRVPKIKSISREEALARLAKRYFMSHGPATVQDFTWWSGLSFADAKKALEMTKTDFFSETIGRQIFWFDKSTIIQTAGDRSVYLLPSYDEFAISYADRSMLFSEEHYKKSITNNGIFKPVIVINGKITGLWKRFFIKDRIIIETEFFRPHSNAAKKSIEKAAEKFGHFLNKETEVKHN